MSPLETINQATQQLLTASRTQAVDILRRLVTEFSNGSYLITSGNIVDETGATTPDFEAVVHAKYDPDPKHSASIAADATAVAFCICDNMTIADLHAAYDRIKQAKSLKKKPAVGERSTITLGIILALKTDLTLNQIADEIEKLNAGTPDRVWADMVAVISSGILNYQGQFVTQDMGGDWLPPAEGAAANQTMPIYVVTILKPTGNHTLHALLHYMMGHLMFFGAAPQLTNITSALDNLPKHGVVRQGYQYNLSGVLKPVPEDMHRDKMMPTMPLLILDPKKNELGQIRYVKWQDGGLIVLRGKMPLEGIAIFLGDPEIMKKLRVTKLPDVQLSNILPLSETQFHQMLANFQRQSNMTICTPPGKFVLQRISDEGTRTPIVARAFLGILKIREAAIVKQPDRDNFDTAYQVIYNELIDLRDTAVAINKIWDDHRTKIISGEIVRRNGQHIEITESIDRQLKSEVSNFLNIAARIIKNNMQTLMKNQGIDVGFLFQKDSSFQNGVVALRTTEPHLADYVDQVRQWSGPLIHVRNALLEHGTFTFPKIIFDFDKNPIEPMQPKINDMPVGDYANLVYDRLASLVEELTAYCLQKKLPAGITIEEIPLNRRPAEAPERFRITMAGQGVNQWNLVYTPDKFEQK